MPAVMPSQVVRTINEIFPTLQSAGVQSFGAGQSPALRGLLDLIKKVPDELITCPPEQFAMLVVNTSTVDTVLTSWQNGKGGGISPAIILDIRNAFTMCPDERPPPVHTTLLFIKDNDLKESIRADVGAAHRSLKNSEWKAATVLAGASIEALLHWKLGEFTKAQREATARAPVVRGAKKDLNDFVLHDCIVVAKDLGVLNANATTAAMLAKDFRNLIHPGKVARTKERCSRSTAYSAIGALEAVIEALTP